MYNQVNFEISGICNARCKYCQTGRTNIQQRELRGEERRGEGIGKFVDVDEFKKSIEYMLSNNFISSDAIIGLFSWGEPFLHPNFKQIIEYLNSLHLSFTLSTNASKPVFFDDCNALKFLRHIIFSMPGFSQESYDRMHGFNFTRIKKNIIDIVENFRQCGFTGVAEIAFHVYQFNLNEIQNATAFARYNDIKIKPYYAYFNDSYMSKRYLKNEFEYMELKSAGQDLLLHGINKRLIEFEHLDKKNYSCPQFNSLTIGEYCNVLLCCGFSDIHKNAIYKKIYEVNNIEEVKTWQKNHKECKECINIGASYIGNNFVLYRMPLNLNIATIYNLCSRLENYESAVIFGAGTVGKLIKESIWEYCTMMGKSLCLADNSQKLRESNECIISPSDAVSKFPNALWIIGSNIHAQSMLQDLRKFEIAEENILLQNY